MKDKINSIDMNGKLYHEEIYNLFKTHSSKANKTISEKIDNFKYNMDFFEYYSNKDIKNLLNIFNLKVSENINESFSAFKSEIEQYISCISQIILTIKLFLKAQDIFKKTFINAKNHLSKLKFENKLENYNENYLLSYLASFFKSKKSHKIYPKSSTILSKNVSSIEFNPKKFSVEKINKEHKIGGSSKGEKESTIYDNSSTAKFESESDEEFENLKRKNSNFENPSENISYKKNDSVFTLSKFFFAEEPSTPKKFESKFSKPHIIKTKTKNFTKITQTENANILKNNGYVFSETDFIIKNDEKKNHCRNLLEMINTIYKKGMINSEEKLKLKQLVIEKSKKIEYLYDNIYINIKADKNRLISEVKKIIG